MLITDKENKNYAFIDLEDIITVLPDIEDEKIKDELKNLFAKETDSSKIRVSKKSKIYKFLKERTNVINGDEYIDSDMLAIAWARAMYEFNHPMKDKIGKYFRMYMDNVAINKSNEVLIHKILCDEKVMDYIRQFDTLEEYENYLIDKQLKKKEVTKQNPEKGRSYVIMD